MGELRRMLLVAAGFVLAACTAQVAGAATAPADPCSLLSASAVSKTMGEAYGAPETSAAPRPFANTVQGTDCRYKTSSGGEVVLFRVYFDHSAAEATNLFARLKMWFGAHSTPASVGDEAYVDVQHAIHVRKGNVRYFLTVDHADTPAGQQRLIGLATLVAGEL